eukprot:TRINITY_DN3011_c0_g1_i2.p1 TRINITY_DN3011_c0_g1~~TRINITY_DN3011_c0_g1_i2.p1  ORF type:complete len:645 (-),score=160.26 TRINITY_DN3011_c0_g1_i2:23-1897(-)
MKEQYPSLASLPLGMNVVHPLALQHTPRAVFHADTFFREFFGHLLFPFSLVFYLGRNYQAGANHQYWTRRPGEILNSYMFPLIVWFINGLLVYRIFTEDSNFLLIEVCIMDALFAIRIVMIAFKYAYLSYSELERFETTTDPDLARYFGRQMQLVSGWVVPPAIVIETELIMAAERQNVNMSTLVFESKTDWTIRNWGAQETRTTEDTGQMCIEKCRTMRALEAKEKGEELEPAPYDIEALKHEGAHVFETKNKKFTAEQYAKYCLGSHLFDDKLKILPSVLAIAITLSFPLVRYLSRDSGHQSYDTNLAYVLSILTHISMVYYFWVLTFFFLVAVYDYYRRAELLKDVGRLISHSTQIKTVVIKDRKGKHRKVTEIIRHEPLVDVMNPHNLYVWALTRRLIDGFGLRYRRRIEGYTSVSALVAIALYLFLLVSIFTGKISIILIYSCAVFVVLIVGLLVALIAYGAIANEQTLVHIETLVKLQLAIRDAVSLFRSQTNSSDMRAVSIPIATFLDPDNIQSEALQSPREPVTMANGELMDDTASSSNSGSTLEYAELQHELAGVPVQQLLACDKMIEMSVRMLKSQDQADPATLFGFRASGALIKSLGAILVSSIALSFNILFK